MLMLVWMHVPVLAIQKGSLPLPWLSGSTGDVQLPCSSQGETLAIDGYTCLSYTAGLAKRRGRWLSRRRPWALDALFEEVCRRWEFLQARDNRVHAFVDFLGTLFPWVHGHVLCVVGLLFLVWYLLNFSLADLFLLGRHIEIALRFADRNASVSHTGLVSCVWGLEVSCKIFPLNHRLL